MEKTQETTETVREAYARGQADARAELAAERAALIREAEAEVDRDLDAVEVRATEELQKLQTQALPPAAEEVISFGKGLHELLRQPGPERTLLLEVVAAARRGWLELGEDARRLPGLRKVFGPLLSPSRPSDVLRSIELGARCAREGAAARFPLPEPFRGAAMRVLEDADLCARLQARIGAERWLEIVDALIAP